MRTTDLVVLCAVCVAGCGKSAAPRASEPAAVRADAGAMRSAASEPAPVDAAPTPSQPHVLHPDDDPACADLESLAAEIHLWRTVANPQPHRRAAQALWPSVPADCRGGTFFLATAEMVGFADGRELRTADGTVVIQSAADALVRGLASEPDHPRLLAHLALTTDLLPAQDAPALPTDACARARTRGGDGWTDYIAYICALVAIHAGDSAGALVELDRVREVGHFPDLTARRAQALALAGRRKEARALVKPATAALARGFPFDIPDSAVAALKKKLAVL